MNMHKFVKSVLIVGILCFGLVSASYAVTISVGKVTTGKGTSTAPVTVSVPITVDNSVGIAGAAFTLVYDHTILTQVDVESEFFDIFTDQWSSLPTPPNPTPTNTTGYDQPVVFNPITDSSITPPTGITNTNGVRIAAARVTAEAVGTNKTLFTVKFQVGDVPLGTYPIRMIATKLNNPTAGYDPADTISDEVPLLVGATDNADLALAFPVLLAAAGFSDNGGGSVTVATASTQLVGMTAAGWHLVSLRVQPTDTAIATVLQPITTKYNIVWAFINGVWKSYNPIKPSNSLTTMESNFGYWIDAKENITLSVTGPLASKNVTLNAGWNLIGFPGDTDTAITTALASIVGQYNIVWAYDGSWKSYNPVKPSNTLTMMGPGLGYWIDMKVAGKTLTFP